MQWLLSRAFDEREVVACSIIKPLPPTRRRGPGHSMKRDCGCSIAKPLSPTWWWGCRAFDERRSLHAHRKPTEAPPGGNPAMTDIVQRRERSHGRGNSRFRFVAGQPTDARAKTRTAPDENSVMREPANQSLLNRRLKAALLPLHDHPHRQPPANFAAGTGSCNSVLDRGHQSDPGTAVGTGTRGLAPGPGNKKGKSCVTGALRLR